MQRSGSVQARRIAGGWVGAWVGAGLLVGGGLVAGRAKAQSFTLTSLHAFSALPSFPPLINSDGADPHAGLVQGIDGNYYGTTPVGGTNGLGTVFKITPTGTLTTLYSFSGPDGGEPLAGLVQDKDGNFYGTTEFGGTNDRGTVYKIAATPTATLNTLYSFSATDLYEANSDGAEPRAGLMLGIDGDLYGTTSLGGNSGDGTVFEIPTTGGILATLHSFSGSDGAAPQAGLVQGGDGNLYGTTVEGGDYRGGTVFTIPTTGGTLTTLYSFSQLSLYNTNSDGAAPYAGLVQSSDGIFYGTTSSGGVNGTGTVFALSPSIIQVASATLVRADAERLQAILVLTNTGSQTVSGLTLTASTLGGSPTLMNLPLKSAASLAPGRSVSISLGFPDSAGGPGQAVILAVSGTYTGGTFTTLNTVTLP